MLNASSDLLQKHDKELFGSMFKEHVLDTTKNNKQTLDVFREVGKKNKTPIRKPFRPGLPAAVDQRKQPWRSAGSHQNNL